MSRFVPVPRLGECRFTSPIPMSDGIGSGRFVDDDTRVRTRTSVSPGDPDDELLFEKAGARHRLFFDPGNTRAAIVTCGGLCPGLNNVIRSATLELQLRYRVREVLGIRYGYNGLNPSVGLPPRVLTAEEVDDIHEEGGTVLGSSRGEHPVSVMADFLESAGVNILLCVGGDGTQRGAHALHAELAGRGRPIAVVGIPKTIDNDIAWCDRTFGLATAVEKAREVLDCAHSEARGAPRGIGLVKLMGREAGFIACYTALASQEANYVLIPEVPFALDGPAGLLATLAKRMDARRHAVIVVAEGAGQDLMPPAEGTDASGNRKLGDFGVWLKKRIADYFVTIGKPVDLKYIDPSYIIRSVPANTADALLCDQLARRAVHAAMAGRTDTLVCFKNNDFLHVPISLAIAEKQRVNPEGELWQSVLAATGQPARWS